MKQLFNQQLVPSGRPLSKAMHILTDSYPVRELYYCPPVYRWGNLLRIMQPVWDSNPRSMDH